MKVQFHTWFNPKNSFPMELSLLFKPKLQNLVLAGLFLLLAQAANAQVSGTVFRDFNANDIKDNIATFNEVGLKGIIVTAYDASGASVGSDISEADGTYSIPGVSGSLYIEFIGLQTRDYTLCWW